MSRRRRIVASRPPQFFSAFLLLTEVNQHELERVYSRSRPIRKRGRRRPLPPSPRPAQRHPSRASTHLLQHILGPSPHVQPISSLCLTTYKRRPSRADPPRTTSASTPLSSSPPSSPTSAPAPLSPPPPPACIAPSPRSTSSRHRSPTSPSRTSASRTCTDLCAYGGRAEGGSGGRGSAGG